MRFIRDQANVFIFELAIQFLVHVALKLRRYAIRLLFLIKWLCALVSYVSLNRIGLDAQLGRASLVLLLFIL